MITHRLRLPGHSGSSRAAPSAAAKSAAAAAPVCSGSSSCSSPRTIKLLLVCCCLAAVLVLTPSSLLPSSSRAVFVSSRTQSETTYENNNLRTTTSSSEPTLQPSTSRRIESINTQGSNDDQARRHLDEITRIMNQHFSSTWGDIRPVAGGKNKFWERTYARAVDCYNPNHPDVVHNESLNMVAPYNDTDQISAGPIIDCQGKALEDCDARERMWELDSYQSLLRGTGHHFRLPAGEGRPTVVLDRTRHSSSSSACFMSEKYLVVASFADKTLYLYEFDVTNRTHTLLDTNTLSSSIDLINCDRTRNRIVGSLLSKRGAVFWSLDRVKKRLVKHNEYVLFPEEVYKGDFLHDVAFVPTSNRVIVSATMRGGRTVCTKHKTIRVLDYKSRKVLADFNQTLNPVTRGNQVKGIRVIDHHHILLVATPYAVLAVEAQGCYLKKQEPRHEINARIILVRMDFDVNDIVKGLVPPAQTKNFTVVDWLSIPFSTPEGLDYGKGLAIAADQLNDRHLLFHVDVNADKPLRHAGVFKGCHVAHGVGFDQDLDLLALTCYGDNSVWLHKLSDVLEKSGIPSAVA